MVAGGTSCSRASEFTGLRGEAAPGIRLNEHLECADGEIVFRHACKLGLEGIMSKRKDTLYRSGRSSDWLKMKSSMCSREARGRRGLGPMTTMSGVL
jgi:ATP-dependent DNA ligase